jgi:hypothetical protein
MNRVSELIKIAGRLNTFENPSPADWKKFERANNRTLPKDFKLMISHFGTGHFGSCLYFDNPCGYENVQLSFDRLFQHRSDMSIASKELKMSLFPEKGGMLRIGECGTREILYFKPDGDEQKLVHCDLSFQELIELPMGVSEFVYRLYRNEIDHPRLKDLGASIWCDKTAPFFTPVRSYRRKEGDASPSPQNMPTQAEIDAWLKRLSEWKDE